MKNAFKEAIAKEPISVRITQQFRERNNMTYELDCSGTPLVVRVFFPAVGADTDASWRIEACAGHPLQAVTAGASGLSRAEAFQSIARDWHLAMPSAASDLDWNGIARVLAAVRAI